MKKALILSIAIVLIISGCKKDKGDPPVLPPVSSMTIDFSNFVMTSKSEVTKAVKGENNTSWEFAAARTKFWIDLLDQVNIPVSGFQVTVDQNPAFVSEKTWEWKYSTTIEGSEYETRLNGLIRDTEVEWKMYITKKTGTGTFSDFLWFEGTSSLDGKSGQWTMNESFASPVAIIKIDWEDIEGTIEHIKYTYVKNDNHINDMIEYGPLTTGNLNAYIKNQYYDVLDAKDYVVDIEWNTNSENGRVKSPQYIGTDWYCWNSNKINVACN